MSDTERQKIEEAGRAAFFNGKPDTFCPFPTNDSLKVSEQRTAWMSGWYAERTNNRIGHILTKYGFPQQ